MNDIITQIGKYCSSQDIKNLRLVNKQWSEHISINTETIELTLNHSKIAVINANTHYFNWLFKYLNKYYPKVHNMTINFTEVNSILMPVNIISLFVNLFYWQDVQSRKLNKTHLEKSPHITLNLKNTTSIYVYHILNGLSSALINTASYHNFYYHDHPIQTNPISLNVSLLEPEFIDIMGVQSINAVYKLVSRVCVLSSIKLHLENHYLLFISPFCISVKDTLHITSDNTIFEVLPIHLEPFRHCPNIILDMKILNNHIFGIEYITQFNSNISYINMNLMDRLLNKDNRIRHLCLYSLIVSNDQCNTFIDKFTAFIQVHPNEVTFSLYNINDIRNAHIIYKILPYIKNVYLISAEPEDWIVSHIIYYLMEENPKLKLVWNIPDVPSILLNSKEDCLEHIKNNNNINILWQFVKF
jgi:hypothetical protein